MPGGSASASASGSGTTNNLYPYANSATATPKPGVLRLGSDSDGSSASAFSDGPNTSLTVPSLAVNNISYFVVPVTFGASFEFALHANAWSGQISSGPFSGQNQTSVD